MVLSWETESQGTFPYDSRISWTNHEKVLEVVIEKIHAVEGLMFLAAVIGVTRHTSILTDIILLCLASS